MQVKDDFEIKNLTAFKIGGKVSKLYLPETQEELTELLRGLDDYIVLGNLSNVLFSSSGYNGNVIVATGLKNYEIKGNTIYADCGIKAPYLSQKACEASLSGVEFMIGLPGTIGGAVYMNAGAHGQRMEDVFVSGCLFDRETKEIVFKQKSEMEFSYRHSLLHGGRYILLSAELELKKAPEESIKTLMDRNSEFRKTIQPSLAYPNAGSIFKNPENDSAGRLLDKAGVKAFDMPNVKVWEKHANFIVNKGAAEAEDVLELMVKMYRAVKDIYTIELQPEIIFVGNKTGVKNEKEEELWHILTKTQK